MTGEFSTVLHGKFNWPLVATFSFCFRLLDCRLLMTSAAASPPDLAADGWLKSDSKCDVHFLWDSVDTHMSTYIKFYQLFVSMYKILNKHRSSPRDDRLRSRAVLHWSSVPNYKIHMNTHTLPVKSKKWVFTQWHIQKWPLAYEAITLQCTVTFSAIWHQTYRLAHNVDMETV